MNQFFNVQVRVLPFGTLEASVILNAPQSIEPREPENQDTVRVLENNTTAQTQILSFPSFSSR